MNIFFKFLNFLKKGYMKIPTHLRGIFIFSILILIIIGIRQYEKFKFEQKVKNGYYVILPKDSDLKIYDMSVNNMKENSHREEKIVQIEVKQSAKSSPFRKKNFSDENLLQLQNNDYSFGKNDAPVVIVEYSNYRCIHCIKFHNSIMPSLKKDYIDNGKVLYIKRIIMQEDTLLASMLPYCLEKSENGAIEFQLVEALYQNLDKWLKAKNSNVLKEISLKNGFTEETFNNCIQNANLANSLLEKQNKDIKSLKIFSTPTIFINGKRERGSIPYSNLKEKIDELLQNNKK